MQNEFERNFIFFLAGAILGGVVVGLTTPFTGRQVRRTVRHKIEDYSDELADAAKSLRETSDRLMRQGEKLMHEAEKRFA